MSENSEMSLILAKLEEISERINQIDEKLNRLTGMGQDVLHTTKRNGEACFAMNEHIGFVEKVYSSVRSPLDYVRKFIGKGGEELPELEN